MRTEFDREANEVAGVVLSVNPASWTSSRQKTEHGPAEPEGKSVDRISGVEVPKAGIATGHQQHLFSSPRGEGMAVDLYAVPVNPAGRWKTPNSGRESADGDARPIPNSSGEYGTRP